MLYQGISVCVRLEHGLLLITDLGADWDVPDSATTDKLIAEPGGIAMRVLHQDDGPVTIDIGSSPSPGRLATVFDPSEMDHSARLDTPSGALWIGDPDQLDGCLLSVPRGGVRVSWRGRCGPGQEIGYLRLVLQADE